MLFQNNSSVYFVTADYINTANQKGNITKVSELPHYPPKILKNLESLFSKNALLSDTTNNKTMQQKYT